MSQERKTDADQGQGITPAEKLARKLAEWECFRLEAVAMEAAYRHMASRAIDAGDVAMAVRWHRDADEAGFMVRRMPSPL